MPHGDAVGGDPGLPGGLLLGLWCLGVGVLAAVRPAGLHVRGDMWSLLLPWYGLRAQCALAFGIHMPHVSCSRVVPWGLSGMVLPHLSVRARRCVNTWRALLLSPVGGTGFEPVTCRL
jgi:hypothetical protein